MNIIESMAPKLFVETSDLGTISMNTSLQVSAINDKSGNGINLVQANSSHQPIMVLSDTNGLPALRCQTSKYIQAASFSLPINYTIYLYLKQTTFQGTGSILVQLGSDYLHGSITQGTSTDGGTGCLSLIGGSNGQPRTKFSYKSDWHLYRYANNGGNVIMSIDDGPIFGDIPNGSYNVGTNTLTNFIVGDNTGEATDFSIQAAVVFGHSVSKDEHKNVWSYFKPKYKPALVKTYFAWGDSITQGFGISNIQNTYVWLVGNGLGADYFNAGIPSTNIGYTATAPSNDLNSLADTLDLGIGTSGYITFCYATNETIDANWGAYYQSIIQRFLDRGYDKNKIAILTQLASAAPAVAASVPYIQAIASNLGIRLADCYTQWLGTPNLIGSNGHPNEAGHAAMATTTLAALA